MSASSLEGRLKHLLIDRLMINAAPSEIGDDDELEAKWKVGSIELMGILVGLEEEFGITFGDDEFTPKKFATVNKIASEVRGKGVQ